MSKEKENIYSVKVGDIFYTEEHRFIHFYQIVALKGTKQIIIREIERKIIGETEANEDLVIPDKNNFIEESACIKDNNLGTTKIVQKRKNYDNEEELYIVFNNFYSIGIDNKIRKHSIYETAKLWDGTPKKHEVIYY